MGSQLVRFSWRVERIAETDKAPNFAVLIKFIGNETCNPSAKRLAADQQRLWPRLARRSDHVAVLGGKRFGFRRRTLRSVRAPRRHVVEFEARHGNAVTTNEFRDRFEERRINPGSRAMRDEESATRILRSVFEDECQRIRSKRVLYGRGYGTRNGK